MLDHLVSSRAIDRYTMPDYGRDTVYRLSIPDIGDVAVVQKGCPDGKHSSVAWSVPDWAVETYLWWLCPSLKNDPGWHVSAGVKRLRAEFFSPRPDALDGVIFHNRTCGTDQRPCPKMRHAIRIGDVDVPPPCIWVLPKRANGPDYNWDGSPHPSFPGHFPVRFRAGVLPHPPLHRLRRLQGVSTRQPNHDHVPVRAGEDHHVQEFLMQNPVLDQERAPVPYCAPGLLVRQADPSSRLAASGQGTVAGGSRGHLGPIFNPEPSDAVRADAHRAPAEPTGPVHRRSERRKKRRHSSTGFLPTRRDSRI